MTANRRNVGFLVALLLSIIFDCTAALAVKCSDYMPDAATGTFSDIEISQMTGDLGGTEIRIVKSSAGYQGSFYMAEGGPSDVVLINNIQYDVKAKRIDLKFHYNDDLWEISGKIENNKLKSEGWPDLELPRKKTFWSYNTVSKIPPRYGDYSNFECDKKVNQLKGAELRIIEANNFERDGYVGLFQIAGETLSNLMLAEVKIDGDDFTFTVHEQDTVYGEFKGKYHYKRGINGSLKLKSGKVIKLVLPPLRSYWER